jgi:hypothetical protein
MKTDSAATAIDDIAGHLAPQFLTDLADLVVDDAAEDALRKAATAIDALQARVKELEAERDSWKGQFESASAAALAVDGMCLVPKEPSEAMLDAAYNEPNSYWHHDTCELPEEWKNEMRSIYRAMLAAANDGEERR